MPRGVPASGRRQPRAVPTAPVGVDPPADVEPAAVVQDRERLPAVEETPPVVAVDVTEDLSGKTDAELTPEQLEIKFLRDQLARSEGRKDPELPYEPVRESDGNIVIHFLEDGLTVNGRLMYRGDELEFDPNGRAYKDTFDRRGRTFLDLRHDEFAQVERWGRIMFRNGPWPGKSYTDGSFEALRAERGEARVGAPSEEELARAEKARKRREAPHLPSLV